MSDCLRRAFETGLRYSGRNEDLSFIPDKASSDMIPELCKRFNLTLHNKPGIQIYPGNVPVLVVYQDSIGLVTNPDEVGFGKPLFHAVFASDIRVFEKYSVFVVITGW